MLLATRPEFGSLKRPCRTNVELALKTKQGFVYTAVRKCGAWRANCAALWLEGILVGAWLAAHDEAFEAFSVLSKLLRPCHGFA